MRLCDRVLPLVRVDEALWLRRPGEAYSTSRHFLLVIDLGDGCDV